MKKRIITGKPTRGSFYLKLNRFKQGDVKPGVNRRLKPGRYLTPWRKGYHTVQMQTPTKTVKLSMLVRICDISDRIVIAHRGRYISSMAEADKIINEHNCFNEDIRIEPISYIHEHMDARGRDLRSRLDSISLIHGINTRSIQTVTAPYGTGAHRRAMDNSKAVRENDGLPF